jgi:hypothetical protein
LDVGGPIAFEFNDVELEILRYVTKTYLHMPLKVLLYDVVYETKPMLAVKKMKQILPMESVNGAAVAAAGFELEDALRAEAQIARGEYVTAIEFEPAAK